MQITDITQSLLDATDTPIEQVLKSDKIKDVYYVQSTGGLWRVYYAGRTAKRTFQSADLAEAWMISISNRVTA